MDRNPPSYEHHSNSVNRIDDLFCGCLIFAQSMRHCPTDCRLQAAGEGKKQFAKYRVFSYTLSFFFTLSTLKSVSPLSATPSKTTLAYRLTRHKIGTIVPVAADK